ncbi:MAG: lipoate protein ligase C-terminal domain-containing protein, partial [Sulfolobales archaeon]
KAVKDVLNVDVVDGELNDWELKELQEVINKYRSNEWVYEFRRGEGYSKICTYKTPAGLIRIHAKVFEGVIESILLTGDFYTYPNTLVNEVEARLKWTPIDGVAEVLEELSRNDKYVIHGISFKELTKYIVDCCSS